MRRRRGNLLVLAARAALSEEASEEAPNLQHDRKKNVPIDSQALFLKVTMNLFDS